MACLLGALCPATTANLVTPTENVAPTVSRQLASGTNPLVVATTPPSEATTVLDSPTVIVHPSTVQAISNVPSVAPLVVSSPASVPTPTQSFITSTIPAPLASSAGANPASQSTGSTNTNSSNDVLVPVVVVVSVIILLGVLIVAWIKRKSFRKSIDPNVSPNWEKGVPLTSHDSWQQPVDPDLQSQSRMVQVPPPIFQGHGIVNYTPKCLNSPTQDYFSGQPPPVGQINPFILGEDEEAHFPVPPPSRVGQYPSIISSDLPSPHPYNYSNPHSRTETPISHRSSSSFTLQNAHRGQANQGGGERLPLTVIQENPASYRPSLEEPKSAFDETTPSSINPLHLNPSSVNSHDHSVREDPTTDFNDQSRGDFTHTIDVMDVDTTQHSFNLSSQYHPSVPGNTSYNTSASEYSQKTGLHTYQGLPMNITKDSENMALKHWPQDIPKPKHIDVAQKGNPIIAVGRPISQVCCSKDFCKIHFLINITTGGFRTFEIPEQYVDGSAFAKIQGR